jgi:hypothetical protein
MFSCTYDDFINNQNVHFTEITPKKDDAECYILLPKEALLSITIGHKSANKSEFVKRLLKEFGFNTTEVELRYTKIKI